MESGLPSSGYTSGILMTGSLGLSIKTSASINADVNRIFYTYFVNIIQSALYSKHRVYEFITHNLHISSIRTDTLISP